MIVNLGLDEETNILDFCDLQDNKGDKKQGTRYKVQGTGYRVQGTRYKVQGTGYRVQGTGFKVAKMQMHRACFVRFDKKYYFCDMGKSYTASSC